jgi:hypothetical protein
MPPLRDTAIGKCVRSVQDPKEDDVSKDELHATARAIEEGIPQDAEEVVWRDQAHTSPVPVSEVFV